MKKTIAIILMTICTMNAQAQFSGKGSGTASAPYQITTADELFEVRNDLSAYYILMNDIDLTEWIEENNPRQGWTPVGTADKPFCGNFDGNYHAIVNMFISRPNEDNIGFFGYTNRASVSNVAFIYPLVSGNDNVGIIGYANISDIGNITVHGGTIEGHNNVGGICGYCKNEEKTTHELSSCYCSANMIGSFRYVAGIVGYLYCNVRMQFNRYDGRIVGNQYAAGIVGYASSKNGYSDDTMRYNIATGSVFGEGYGTATIDGGSNLYGIGRGYSMQDTLFCREQEVSHYITSFNADGLAIFEKGRKVENRDAETRYGQFYPLEQFYKKSFYFSKMTSMDGKSYDFKDYFAIIEDSIAPYNVKQTRPVANVQFTNGSKSTISGNGVSGAVVYVLVNGKVFKGVVDDGVWRISLGMTNEGAEARVFIHEEGKLPSIVSKFVAQSQNAFLGDANNDGQIDSADIVATVNYIVGNPSSSFSFVNADVNGDGRVLIDDVTQIIQIILNNQ